MSSTAITRITHSCHLIEIGSRTFLTDPWFSERPGYHPGEPAALGASELPRLDAVLISHHHYDHCDLKALRAYRDKDVPMLVAGPVAARARRHGFTNVTALAPWQTAQIGGVTVTAAPARHAVYEVTFVLSDGKRTVYFAGDTLLIPELRQLPGRFGHFDLLLVPTNGLRIRPQAGKQVVMNAAQAAELTAILRPDVAVPHHYAFTSGWLGDRLLTKSDPDPRHYAEAAAELAPATEVRITQPGTRVAL
jgi:L-ascorbate metabolism protein UlaG (beta-lactamase superfamily)